MKAVFLWKEHDSTETADLMLPMCLKKAQELEWGTDLKLFTEGFGPSKSWDELRSLAGQGVLTGVILHNLGKWHGGGQILLRDLDIFKANNVPVALALMDYTTVGSDVLRIVADSHTYYSRLRSQSIRSGMKAKRGGRPPFGMSYNEDGDLVQNEDWQKVAIIFNLSSSGMSISEIARMTSLGKRKVRSVLETHAARFNA